FVNLIESRGDSRHAACIAHMAKRLPDNRHKVDAKLAKGALIGWLTKLIKGFTGILFMFPAPKTLRGLVPDFGMDVTFQLAIALPLLLRHVNAYKGQVAALITVKVGH